ncbi:MAG: tRNA (guanosine(37)-N1)-methyltransferase TrmD [Oscillospiraceae bacterium]|nr:tRNA (guanosine(37)-N1)-methyltransferase TrmD [Oscillospiraceae bacterium]
MQIDIMTLFPDMCESYLSESIIGRAIRKGALNVRCHNIRDYTLNKQKQTDDAPFGGGMGMVMYCQPIYDCFQAICDQRGKRPHLIYMSPAGKVFNQAKAVELSKMDNICILCGHYEGVDERVIEEIVDEEISIGDYVVTGGEMPALIVTDAVARLCEGVLSDEECYSEESHYSGLLEYPQYTRPYIWNGREVPEVLRSGHHANIEKWKKDQALRRTRERRPDMYEQYISEHPEDRLQD